MFQYGKVIIELYVAQNHKNDGPNFGQINYSRNIKFKININFVNLICYDYNLLHGISEY